MVFVKAFVLSVCHGHSFVKLWSIFAEGVIGVC